MKARMRWRTANTAAVGAAFLIRNTQVARKAPPRDFLRTSFTKGFSLDVLGRQCGTRLGVFSSAFGFSL